MERHPDQPPEENFTASPPTAPDNPESFASGDHSQGNIFGDTPECDNVQNPPVEEQKFSPNEILNDNLLKRNDGGKVDPQKIKAKVDVIHVSGLSRTKDDVVVKSVQEIFEAKNFEQVLLLSHKAKKRLEALGAFQNVGVLLDTNKDPLASPEGIEVCMNVEEKKWLAGGINTLVGNNEGSVVVSVKLPNTLGRGEAIHCEYQQGTKNSGFNVSFNKPFLCKGNPQLSTSLFQQGAEYPWSGFKQIDRGLFLELAFNSTPLLNHSLRWEGLWRELNPITSSPAFEVREELGHSCKSSFKHILKIDSRDAVVFPSEGTLMRLQQELSGFGGDVSLVKHELEYQTNYRLPLDSVFQFCFSAGILKGWGSNKYYNISDKFFLGGPLSIRGFQMRGIGPQSHGSALGADSFWAGALHLYTPLPFVPPRRGLHNVVRTHFFLNTGNIGNFTLAEDYHHYLRSLMTGLRWSFGAGLVLSINNVARFEVNYAMPIASQTQDKLCPGLQFGIGLSFL